MSSARRPRPSAAVSFVLTCFVIGASMTLTGLLGGCGSSGGGTPGPGSNGGITGGGLTLPRSNVANWTVLIYMHAANNLEPFSVENMDQMEQAPYNTNANVVVEWKRFHGSNTVQDDQQFDAAAPEFDGTRRFWLT